MLIHIDSHYKKFFLRLSQILCKVYTRPPRWYIMKKIHLQKVHYVGLVVGRAYSLFIPHFLLNAIFEYITKILENPSNKFWIEQVIWTIVVPITCSFFMEKPVLYRFFVFYSLKTKWNRYLEIVWFWDWKSMIFNIRTTNV